MEYQASQNVASNRQNRWSVPLWWSTFGFAGWLLAILICFLSILSYESIPGVASAPPCNWPASSHLRRHSGKFNLVMFVHPKCPCSRASIDELDHLMDRKRNYLEATVLLLKPNGTSSCWEIGEVSQRVTDIPGVQLVTDLAGTESAIFAANTSGETLLYSPEGKLIFRGGITAGRGHEGDNQGLSILRALLDGSIKSANATPVFGCALADDPSPNQGVFLSCKK